MYQVDGEEYSKDCFGSWEIYENKGTSSFAVLQAALSQATKNFWLLLGIWSDLNETFEENRFDLKDVIDIKEETKDFSAS